MSSVVSGVRKFIDGQNVARLSVLANMPVIAISYATGGMNGDLVQAYALDALGIGPALLGLALGLMLVSIPVQFGLVDVVERLGFRRTMVIGYVVLIVLITSLGALPLLPTPLVFPLFAATVVLIEICVSCSWGLAWHPWMQAIIPRGERPAFLSQSQAVAQGFNLVMLAIFAFITGNAVSAVEYQLYLGILAAFVLVSVVAFLWLPEAASSVRRQKAASAPSRLSFMRSATRGFVRVGEGLRAAVVESNNRRLLVIYVIDIFLATPLLAGYAIAVLGMPAAMIAVAIGARSLFGVFLGPVWGRLLKKHGFRRTLTLSLTVTSVLKLGWLFIPPQPDGVATLGAQVAFAAIVLLSAIFGIGYGLSINFLWYELTPDEHAVPLFALKDVLESGKAQIAMAIAGVAISVAVVQVTQEAEIPIDLYKILVLLYLPSVIGIFVLIRGIRLRTEQPSSETPE